MASGFKATRRSQMLRWEALDLVAQTVFQAANFLS
jgi:hypothetical protein